MTTKHHKAVAEVAKLQRNSEFLRIQLHGLPLDSHAIGRDGRRSGTVLVVALVCMLIVTAMLATMLQGTLRARRQLHIERDRRQTELLLQAGADRAAARLLQDADYRGETWRLPAATFAGRGEALIHVEASRDSDDAPWEVRVVAEYPAGSDASVRRTRTFHISTLPTPIQE